MVLKLSLLQKSTEIQGEIATGGLVNQSGKSIIRTYCDRFKKSNSTTYEKLETELISS